MNPKSRQYQHHTKPNKERELQTNLSYEHWSRYGKNVHHAENNLQTQCNPNQNSNSIPIESEIAILNFINNKTITQDSENNSQQ